MPENGLLYILTDITGIMALGYLGGLIVLGLLQRPLKRYVWAKSLHKELGWPTVAFTVVHASLATLATSGGMIFHNAFPWGLAALILLGAVMGSSILKKQRPDGSLTRLAPYKWWRRWHNFALPALGAAGVHTWMAGPDGTLHGAMALTGAGILGLTLNRYRKELQTWFSRLRQNLKTCLQRLTLWYIASTGTKSVWPPMSTIARMLIRLSRLSVSCWRKANDDRLENWRGDCP